VNGQITLKSFQSDPLKPVLDLIAHSIKRPSRPPHLLLHLGVEAKFTNNIDHRLECGILIKELLHALGLEERCDD